MKTQNKIAVVADRERLAFSRNEKMKFSFCIMNFFPNDIKDCSFKIKVENIFEAERLISNLGVTIPELNFEFEAEKIKAGNYIIDYFLNSKSGILAQGQLPFTVYKDFRKGKMEFWHWPATVHYNAIEAGEQSAKEQIDILAELGYTWAQIRDTWILKYPENASRIIEYAASKGIALGLFIDNGTGAMKMNEHLPDDARLKSIKGESSELVCVYHPAVIKYNKTKLERTIFQIQKQPSCQTVFMNSEIEDKLQLPLDEKSIKRHEKSLGFSISEIKELDVVNSNPCNTCETFLKPGVISDKDRQYEYAKYYYKKGDGFVFANKLQGDIARKYRPDIETISDPLRLCSLFGRFDGVDLISSWTYTNPDPKMMLFIESLEAAALPEKKEILHTITLWSYAGWMSPSGLDRMAREYTLRMGPDRYLETAWINFSRGPRGIGTYYGSPIEPGLEGGDDFIYSPATLDAVRRFSKEVIQPFGEFARKTVKSPRKVAVLDSFASRVYGTSPRPYNHYPNYYIYNFYTVMNMAHIAADVVFEDSLINDGLDKYDILVLPCCDTLPESVYEIILDFAKRGGVVVADQYLRAKIPGVIKFDFDFTYRNRVNANANYKGKDFTIKDDRAYRKEWQEVDVAGVSAEEDQKIMEAYAEQLRTGLEGKVLREVDCSSNKLLLNLRKAGEVKYLFVINDNRTYGERVGKYKSMLEKGLTEKAVFYFKEKRNDIVLYDLTCHEEIEYSRIDKETIKFELKVEAAWGKIIAVFPERIEKLKVKNPDKIKKGEKGCFKIENNVKTGLSPVKVVIRDASNCINEYSDYYVVQDGVLSLNIIPALNEPAGTWSINVFDLTSGINSEKKFIVH